MTSVPEPIQQASGQVGLLDIYTRQIEMGAQLAVIGEQLKAIPDHERRIRVLEASSARLLGAAIGVSAAVSAAGTWVGFILTHK